MLVETHLNEQKCKDCLGKREKEGEEWNGKIGVVRFYERSRNWKRDGNSSGREEMEKPLKSQRKVGI